MKKLTLTLGLLVLLGSTGIASAYEDAYVTGPRVTAAVTLPGMRLVMGRPGVYCSYGGHYYSRMAWNRFYRSHQDRDRVVYNRSYGNNDRRFDRNENRGFDRDRNWSGNRGYRGDDHFNRNNLPQDQEHDRN